MWTRRHRRSSPPSSEPSSPAEPCSRGTSATASSPRVPVADEPVVPPEVATVLSVLRSSAVIVDDTDTVVKASAPAYALGLVRGTQLVSEELDRLVHEVRRDGQIRETELLMDRPSAPARHVTARVAPLGSRLVLALVEDRTRERRVEAVRRDFVANVSHELKTPVGAIKLLAEAVVRRQRRPGGGQAVRRPDAHRERPAHPAGAADHRAVPAAGRRPARDPDRGEHRRRHRRRGRHQRDRRGLQADRHRHRRHARARGVRQRGAGHRRGGQPGRQRRLLLRDRLHRPGHHQGRGGRRSRSRSSTRASASRPTRSTGSSSGSTGSTRPGTAPREAPGSASRSSSTSPPPTAATSGCGPSRARGRRSR